MKILAQAVKEREYLYDPRTAHKVSNASGERIRDALNRSGYGLKSGRVWHMYDVDEYDTAYDFAQDQAFKVYRGSIREARRAWAW